MNDVRPGGSWRPLPFALVLWLPAAVAATVLAGAGYALAQHVLRSSANDPQVQIAEDAAHRLAGGATPEQVAQGAPIDLASSLDITVGVFSSDGRALASTARLDGATPAPPPGALRAASTLGRNVLTWQPRPGVREAAVIVPFTGPAGSGSVVVARSLRLVEQREDDVLLIAALGWLLALAGAALAALVGARLWSPPPPPPGALTTASRVSSASPSSSARPATDPAGEPGTSWGLRPT